MRIVLHIGFEKTGTTTIQNAMWHAAKVLRRQGVLYPLGFGRRGHEHLALAMIAPELMTDIRYWQQLVQNPDDFPTFRADIRERLGRQIARVKPETMVVSTEFLSSRLEDAVAVRSIKEFFAPWSDDFTIVAGIRRQDDTFVSHYSTTVKGNCDQRLDVYDQRAFWLDYNKVLGDWAEVFGAENLVIRTFPPEGGDLLKEFTDACGLPDIPSPPQEHLNPSLDHLNASLLADLNKRLPTHVDMAPNPARAGLVDFLEARSNGPKLEIGLAARQALLDDYAEGNEAVRARFFPDRATLFATDLSDAPVPEMAGYEDALDLVIDIWSERAEVMARLHEAERKSARGRVRALKNLARRILRRWRFG